MSEERLRSLLAWERGVLAAVTTGALLDAAACAPHGDGEVDAAAASRAVTLLLADPGDELRRLAFGGDPRGGEPRLLFSDGLIGMAPQFAALHRPWLGPYRAADHSLLFRGHAGLRSVALFPIHARGALAGSLCIATTGVSSGFEALDPDVLAQAGDVVGVAVERVLDRMRLRRGGLVDPLTGWNTRRYLRSRLTEEIARCQRHGGFVTCALVGVDGLQKVNEEFGQLAGDHALREIAARVDAQLRASDAAARLDSDAFAILLADSTTALALPLAERIIAAVRGEPVPLGNGRTLGMTVSIGLAALPARPDADRKTLSDQILAMSIAALQQAKGDGRNRIRSADGLSVSGAGAPSGPGTAERRPAP